MISPMAFFRKKYYTNILEMDILHTELISIGMQPDKM